MAGVIISAITHHDKRAANKGRRSIW